MLYDDEGRNIGGIYSTQKNFFSHALCRCLIWILWLLVSCLLVRQVQKLALTTEYKSRSEIVVTDVMSNVNKKRRSSAVAERSRDAPCRRQLCSHSRVFEFTPLSRTYYYFIVTTIYWSKIAFFFVFLLHIAPWGKTVANILALFSFQNRARSLLYQAV